MKRPRRIALGVALFALLRAGGAGAQAGEEARPVLTPPRLTEFVEAPYPSAEREGGREADVELELTIDLDGRVTEAKVVSSAGPHFDAAAREAAQRFRFEPARRDGEPIAAVIRYRYRFVLEKPPAPEVSPTGRLEGRVVGLEDDAPLESGEVILTDEEGRVARRATLSSRGGFAFEELPPGRYSLRVTADELGTLEEVEEVRAGESTEVTYRMRLYDEEGKEADELTFGAVAVVDAPPREVVRRTIERAQLTRIPGTRGDALRTVELLPGVGRPPFGVGLLVIRGSAPSDSAVFFEGADVPLLYHFGGLTSFINSRLIERIDLYPGNFSARYGRRIGGILEVEGREPAQDRFHGVAELSVIDVSLLAEGPISDKVSVAAGLRRSHIDLIFDKVVPDDALDVVAAPVYWDYQLFLGWKPTTRDKVRFMVYGSSDAFRIILPDPVDSDPAIRGDVELGTQFHLAHLLWRRRVSDKLEQDLSLQFGSALFEFALSDAVHFEGVIHRIEQRSEWRYQVSKTVRLIGGLDLAIFPADLEFKGPPPRQAEGAGANQEPLTAMDSIDVSIRDTVFQPGFYLESDLRPSDDVRVVLGLRLDYFNQIEEWAFDPRVVGFYSFDNGTQLKVGLGLFSQPPEFPESADGVGNPDLEPIKAIHLGAGVEHDLAPGIKVGGEVFMKHLYDRVLETPGGLPPVFKNGGVGRIYGAELSALVQPREGRFAGVLSYTLSRSRRQDGKGEPLRPFDFDQTHIFALASMYRLPRHWEIGATVRLVSGNPRTPVVGSLYDAGHDVYLPINGRINSERNPLFNRLDFRVEKKWVFHAWNLALYLDIQNLYNARNPEGELYNFDFSERKSVRGLPIIPALGIRGEI